MPYYQGDFYRRGDFYSMGDPGFFSFLGKAVGFGKKLIGAFLPHRPVVAATTGIMRRGAEAITGTIVRHPVLTAAGAAGVIGAAAGAGAEAMRALPGAVAKGFHMIKKGPHAGRMARNRRMRVTNPKALRRALRRTYGFERLAMKVIRLHHPRKRAAFGGFRYRRKKRAA